jgi:hypothetical protein
VDRRKAAESTAAAESQQQPRSHHQQQRSHQQQKLNYSLLPEPPNFSLLSTFKVIITKQIFFPLVTECGF